MPAVTPGSRILVTGASGFIATHLVSHLLMNGFKVRGTVRSESKGKYLEKLFKGVGEFEYVIVEDIADSESFNEAVKGVEGIAHTASPFYLNAESVEELVIPAVQGTEGVMKAALKHNPDLKRMIITSSVAAIMEPKPSGARHAGGPPYHFTEEDWNNASIREIEEKKDAASGPDKYKASKTLAEKTAWKFVEENKPSWDIATINPPMVLGPIIHQVESPEKLNTSVAGFWAYIQGKKKNEDLQPSFGNWVDVRDVAEAHYKALITPEAGGNRFIVSAGPYCGQDIVDIIHSWPGDKIKSVPVGKPGTGPEIDAKANVFVGKKAHDVLGFHYTKLYISVEDMYKSLVERFGKPF